MNQKRECVREKIYSVIIIKMLVMKTIYKRIAKRTLLLILIVHLSMLSYAATYYVSNTGSDSNNGTSISTAWQTLTKVNSKSFVAGDQILFQRGNTFYGSITVKNSGIAGNPITFGAYGTGTNPIITGFTSITAWTNLGSNIWESTNTVSTLSTCNMVVINGVNTAKGRYPNADLSNGGFLTIASHPTSTSLTCSALTGSPNWSGAEIVIRENDWTFSKRTVTAQTGTTVNYDSSCGAPTNYGFFFQNDNRTLDQQNEWYYNPSTKKISIYSTSQPVYVKIATVEDIFTIASSVGYVSIDGIDIVGANSRGIFRWVYGTPGERVHDVAVKNCNFSYSGMSAIAVRADNIIIENCTFNQSNTSAVDLHYSKGVQIKNNTIQNTGLFAGMGVGFSSIEVGGSSDKALIEYNTIINSGHNPITFGSDISTISYNFIDNFNSVIDDGGGIYGGSNATITHNIVLNGVGAWKGSARTSGGMTIGIYLDDGSINNTISFNSIYNCAAIGLFLHNASNNTVENNVSFGNYEQISIKDDNISPTLCTNNIIRSNIFVTKSASTVVADYYSVSNDLLTNGTVLDNNYYSRPIDDNIIIRDYQPAYGNNFKTLAQWKTYSGQDANSNKSPMAITNVNDLRFEYNATTSPKTVSLAVPMIDIKGTKYAGSVTLQPFNSVVLMKDLTPVVVPGAPTSPVATAGNASASVSFVAPTSNGGSVITGYTVTSIPAGGVDANVGSTSLTHSITGLTNGTSYTFTVKATNSAGASVASVASNSVTPKAPVATGFLFTGPSSGNVNTASANFTVTPNNPYNGTITITPSGAGSTGLSAIVLTFTNSSTAKTFTITPSVAGSITLTPSNNGSLTNPANITYTTNAVVPGAPTSPIATAGNASASITFVAPTSNGGSAITGYTVTSLPAGGIDANAGSTSLTHTITGLANGTSYTFTVKAINSAGTSLASAASNLVMPVAVVIKQGDITPSHFTTVWQGSNGLNHMNIIVASAMLEDLPLSVNDEIAVFCGSACVGSAKLIQSIVPTDNTSLLTILASQSDGSNNGFIENDTIIFKVWDNTNKVEKQINGAVYRNDVATWKTTGRYVPGSTAMVEITSYQVYTQSIELLKGYNMISTYVSAQNPNASAVTKTLVDQGNLVKMQDETGNSFENWGDFGGWINQLGALEKTEGYKIQVANNCTLQVTGRTIAMPLNISLKTGWNIISYPRTDLVNAMNVVQALIDQNKLVKVQDEAGNSIENWGLFGGWKNGIGNFIPGKAYKVKMNSDAILTFQESYPKSALVIAKSEETEYYHSTMEGNGTDHMNINITDIKSVGISVGDELAAFDGDICVATTKINEADLLSGSASLVSSFSTDNQNPNGFKVGDPIQIALWSKLSGDESKVNAEVITGQLKYEKNASVLVKMKSATITTGLINLDDAVKIDVFPNPCQDRVTVRFSEIPEANSRIEISDISGRKLISRIVSGTSEEFNLESFTSGLYLVRSILGSNEFVQKLIVNK